MSLYGTAVRKPVSTALVFVAIVIFGLFSLSRLSVDLLPEIETNTIMVMTAYPGASASDIDLVKIHGYGYPRWRGGPMFQKSRINP